MYVRCAESPEKELRYGNYLLDGYVARPGEEKDLAIEVNGFVFKFMQIFQLFSSCYWHACPHCYPDPDTILAGGFPASTVREKNAERLAELEKRFEVEIYWECEINSMLEDEENTIQTLDNNGQLETITMRSFFDNIPDSGLIDLHDAFFGYVLLQK